MNRPHDPVCYRAHRNAIGLLIVDVDEQQPDGSHERSLLPAHDPVAGHPIIGVHHHDAGAGDTAGARQLAHDLLAHALEVPHPPLALCRLLVADVIAIAGNPVWRIDRDALRLWAGRRLDAGAMR